MFSFQYQDNNSCVTGFLLLAKTVYLWCGIICRKISCLLLMMFNDSIKTDWIISKVGFSKVRFGLGDGLSLHAGLPDSLVRAEPSSRMLRR